VRHWCAAFDFSLSSSRPWSGPLPLLLFPMAPITDSTVSDLKDLVHKLEARVHQLETRLGDGGKKPKSPSDSMRMILIGPPGAGEPRYPRTLILQMLTSHFYREGYSSTADQGQILRLSSGEHSSKNPENRSLTSCLRLQVICYELRSRRKLPSGGKQKRSWIKAD
jgi:hypothetical protein